MRFLCFHGKGTNAKIFEAQTARLRQALGRQHEFIFINGPVIAKPAPGFTNVAGLSLSWVIPDIDRAAALEAADRIVAAQGPFDGLMGFSEGSIIAAWMILEDIRRQRGLFRCGIFFCAPMPEYWGTEKIIAQNEVISVPTAHIWSRTDDTTHHNTGRELAELCNPDCREDVVHNLGHTVPGSLVSEEGFYETIRAIERTIARAMRPVNT